MPGTQKFWVDGLPFRELIGDGSQRYWFDGLPVAALGVVTTPQSATETLAAALTEAATLQVTPQFPVSADLAAALTLAATLISISEPPPGGSQKYWLDGLPFAELDGDGSQRYWIDGLPLPALDSSGGSEITPQSATETLAAAITETAALQPKFPVSEALAAALTLAGTLSSQTVFATLALAAALTESASVTSDPADELRQSQELLETAEYPDNAVRMTAELLEDIEYPGDNRVLHTAELLETTEWPLNEVEMTQECLEVVLYGYFVRRPNHSFIRAYMATGHEANASFSV